MQPDQGAAVLQFLLPVLEQEVVTTRKVLAAVPSHKGDYRPDERSMSALELCWHIAGAEAFFTTAITTGAFPTPGKMPESIKAPQDVVVWYDGQVKNNLPKIKALTGEQCIKVLESPIGALPVVSFVNLMINHTVHHRGQLSAYLRPMGAKVPSIYGHSRDDKEAKQAAV
ncbi:MAG TPA: DinB family protein [Candidatus Angelobacter sp.]|jgi:uncharacterized damage-inducible protein DinB|nr:DinB family protein [Candidatus Angelobacter sp.]